MNPTLTLVANSPLRRPREAKKAMRPRKPLSSQLPDGSRGNIERTSNSPPVSLLLVWTAPGGTECVRMGSSLLISDKGDRPSLEQIIRIGMDTSKHVFQLHGVNAVAGLPQGS